LGSEWGPRLCGGGSRQSAKRGDSEGRFSRLLPFAGAGKPAKGRSKGAFGPCPLTGGGPGPRALRPEPEMDAGSGFGRIIRRGLIAGMADVGGRLRGTS